MSSAMMVMCVELIVLVRIFLNICLLYFSVKIVTKRGVDRHSPPAFFYFSVHRSKKDIELLYLRGCFTLTGSPTNIISLGDARTGISQKDNYCAANPLQVAETSLFKFIITFS